MKYDFLISKLKSLIAGERKLTAEIIEVIREVDQKRIYLEYGHTSMFSFLTKDFGYTPSAAMRRIDAARLSQELPEINKSLKSGDLNLSQISMIAQAVRQKEKDKIQGSQKSSNQRVSKEIKALLIEKVQSLDLAATQKALAQDLDFKVQVTEKKTYQKDESIRLELTLSKELQEDLNRVKEFISHQNPNPSMAELIQFLADHFLNKKDPLRKKSLENKSKMNKTEGKPVNVASCKETAYAATVALSRQSRTVSAKVRRDVFDRDQCCQWVTKIRSTNGKIIEEKCQSRFQLQIDHIKPKWQGGSNKQQNLQVLCGVHNRLKYQYEVKGKASQIEIFDHSEYT